MILYDVINGLFRPTNFKEIKESFLQCNILCARPDLDEEAYFDRAGTSWTTEELLEKFKLKYYFEDGMVIIKRKRGK